MLPTDNPIIPPSVELLEELSEILAWGALRLFLKRGEKKLKGVDFPGCSSDELDCQLTAKEKGREAA